MIVAKFGGTSVGTIEAMQRSAAIVAAHPDRKLVVISATSGTTNDLVALATSKTPEHQNQLLKQIEERHQAVISGLSEAYKTEAQQVFDRRFKDLESHLAVLGREKRWSDKLFAFGELMSTDLFVLVLREQGVEATWLDAREVIKTDSHFGKAEPELEAIRRKTAKMITPGQVYLTQGFIGSDSYGQTTTLGRGGSDLSAALFAEALDADYLEIWTDVAGVYTTDPRIVKNAFPIGELSFDEAAELSVFGGKVLHPATLKPAIRGDVKVRVASSSKPDVQGTVIVNEPVNKPVIRAISLRKDQTLLTVKSLEMLHQHGFLARLFQTLADHKISVDLVTTSEVSVSLTLDTALNASNQVILDEVILSKLRAFCEVEVEKGLNLIALIGNNLHHTSGIGGQLFTELEGYNIRLVCHGASSHNLCFLVAGDNGEEVVRMLHAKFIEH
ncbi:MAG: lysine-sensitive aspartokinase 3 [Bacteroidota bacterium]